MLGQSAGRLNAANAMSLARAGAIPFILVLLALPPAPPARWGAAALFAVAAITDGLDGYLARRHAGTSALGAVLDLTADKLLVAAVLIALVALQDAPAWAAIIVVGRELLVSGIRIYAAERSVAVPAQALGKLKMVITCVAILAAILAVPGAWWLIATATALTVASAWPYGQTLVRLLYRELPESTSI